VSQENVEIARAISREWERGDFSSSEWADPDIEFVSGAGPDEAVHRGVEAMGRAWREWLSAWEDFQIEPREFIDAGDEVLILVEFGDRGKTSGASVDAMQGGSILSFRDGKVVRIATYTERAEVLEAWGLRE
jgi:ketosteroid isomerase-like protein